MTTVSFDDDIKPLFGQFVGSDALEIGPDPLRGCENQRVHDLRPAQGSN